MKLHIAIDTNPIYVTQAGVARYVRGLLQGLKQIDDSRLNISPIAWEHENFQYDQPRRALKTLYREFVWYRFVAPAILKRRDADLLHMTQVAPFGYPRGVKTVCNLHDCAVIRHPERFRRWQRFSGQLNLRKAIIADRVICISRFAADEAMRLLNISADKLEVIYLGNTFEGARIAPQQPDIVLPERYFLFIGSLEPGKNLQLLSETYRLADEQNLDIPPLIIVGSRWQGVEKEAGHKRWLYLGHQPDAAVAYLYQHASALLFPSKYEGFGLPVLEAMSYGCPVLCSRVASIPEVAGDAALYAEQTPIDYLLKISELIGDNALQSDLGKAGRKQAAKFSWERCAKQTRDLYLDMI